MEITVHNTPTKLLGRDAAVGTDAPAAAITLLDGSQNVIGSEQVNVQLIVTVPSLKTEVCSYGAKKFNEMLAEAKKLDAVLVTTDDLDVCKKFVEEGCIENIRVVRDANKMFGEKFGVLIGEGMLNGKLARSVFVIDKEGQITYREIVGEVTKEADYDAAIAAVEEAKAKKKKHVHGHHNHGW